MFIQTIPLGLPHVVQFVEASLCHLPMSVRFVGGQTEPLRQREGRGLDGGFLPLPDHRAGQQKHRRPSSQLIESLGRPGEETRAGRKDRKSNTMSFWARPATGKPSPQRDWHRPLGCPGPVPQRERSTEGRDRRAAGRAGPAHERRNHCSPRSDRWRRGPTPGAALAQLRNRRF